MATVCSAMMPALPPNPPPTCGVMTRIWAGSRPTTGDASVRNICGICVDTYTVWAGPSPWLGTTTMALPSMGTTATRWFSIRARTTTSAVANRSAFSGSRNPPMRLPGSASNSCEAPSSNACSASTTARSTPYSTTTNSDASTAAASVWATTTATMSPTKRTLSTASGGRLQASLTGMKA